MCLHKYIYCYTEKLNLYIYRKPFLKVSGSLPDTGQPGPSFHLLPPHRLHLQLLHEHWQPGHSGDARRRQEFLKRKSQIPVSSQLETSLMWPWQCQDVQHVIAHKMILSSGNPSMEVDEELLDSGRWQDWVVAWEINIDWMIVFGCVFVVVFVISRYTPVLSSFQPCMICWLRCWNHGNLDVLMLIGLVSGEKEEEKAIIRSAPTH